MLPHKVAWDGFYLQRMLINLLYHDVTPLGQEDTSGFSGPEAARYKLAPEDFCNHLQQIAAVTRVSPLARTSPAELRSNHQSNWTISFDDGGLSAINEIANQLERLGWRGWFFFATDFIGLPSFCSRDQVLELHRRGHVIGSHSCSHPERISSCPWQQLMDEWSRSCQILAEIINEPVTSASVPGGFYSKEVAKAAASAGIQVLFNSEPTTSTFSVDGMLVLGRYNVYRGMPPNDAAALVTSPFRRWRQMAFWNMKKIAKTFAAPAYKAIRRSVLARQSIGKDSSK